VCNAVAGVASLLLNRATYILAVLSGASDDADEDAAVEAQRERFELAHRIFEFSGRTFWPS
jgi:hypothetical protein